MPTAPRPRPTAASPQAAAARSTRAARAATRVPVGGLVLFHGAGGNRDHHTFLVLEAGLEVPVARVNFPYRDKGPGRRPPDPMPRLLDAVAAAAERWAAEWGVGPDRLVLGGRSLGGRAASIAIAEGRVPARGLLLLSYPLHPPGKPDSLRVDHFGAVTCPVLLIQGTKDPFGSPDEFARHLPALAGPLDQTWIDAGHDPKKHDDVILASAQAWLEQLAPPPARARRSRPAGPAAPPADQPAPAPARKRKAPTRPVAAPADQPAPVRKRKAPTRPVAAPVDPPAPAAKRAARRPAPGRSD